MSSNPGGDKLSVASVAQASLAKRGRENKNAGSTGLIRRTTVGVSGGVYNYTETLKEKQARFREEREKRKIRLGQPHKYLISYVAEHLQLDSGVVEEFILDSPEQIEMLDSFIGKNGRKALLFFYQEGESPKLESGRIVQKTEKMMKVFVTDGKREAIIGQCLYFIKPRGDQVLMIRNIHEEINFGVLDVADNGGLLPAIRQLMAKVYVPTIQAMSNWGHLTETPHGKKTKETFVHSVENFVHYLDSAQMNVDGAVHLHDCVEVDLRHIKGASDCATAAKDPDMISKLEELVSGWRKQIEQVLAESEQMRKEADDTGPLAELEHWRFLMAKFNSLLEHIKGDRCKAAINTLHLAKSKVLKAWRGMDVQITDHANEAKDNVKYLYSLEKTCTPLYNSDPVSMVEVIPTLINIISMIHNISRYYNTSQRMTSLFIKVTNQMVTACRKYITENGQKRIWDQDRFSVKKKISDCISLYKQYVDGFQKMKIDLQTGPERNLDFSEMYIFGKFDTFCRRLNKITELLQTIEVFSMLSESKIEGIDSLSNKFLAVVTNTKKKPYDILDHRKVDFDNDFESFRESIHNLECQLQSFMDGCFDRVQSAAQALLLLKRFEKLKIPCLQSDIKDKYGVILHTFSQEIEEIKRLYQKFRDDPPIPRDMPPIAGKIMWSRQLFRKIQEPMEVFQENAPELLKDKEGKILVKNYNRMGKILMEFEVLYYRAWCRETDNIKYALQATLLVRHPETKQLYINYDPQIPAMVREATCMIRMDLEVPEVATNLLRKIDDLKNTKETLETLLSDYEKAKESIPVIMQPLMKPHLKQVDRAIRHGLIFTTWSSLNHKLYFHNVEKVLGQLKRVIREVNDLKEARIDDMLQDITTTSLVNFDDESTYTLFKFLAWRGSRYKTAVTRITGPNTARGLSGAVEFYESLTPPTANPMMRGI